MAKLILEEFKVQKQVIITQNENQLMFEKQI
jgi:hypothetical protein